MIDPAQIKKKAERLYPKFLTAIITGEPFFPIDFPIGAIPKDYPTLSRSVAQLMDHAKQSLGYGYHLALESRTTRKYGSQSLPKWIGIETEPDYLKLLKKTREVSQFRLDLDLIRAHIPELESWLYHHPLKVIEYRDLWKGLIQVCQYFQQHPQPNLYIRELPIRVHTKFIENNKRILRDLLEAILPVEHLASVAGEKDHIFEKRFSLRYREPLIRFRVLDPALTAKYGLPGSDISMPTSEFRTLNLDNHRCFITENLMNFLTLPPLDNSVALFGSGYGIGALKSIPWLSNCSIFYWGDLDSDGFRILAQLRFYFPQVTSIMMDLETFELFQEFAVPVVGAIAEPLPQLTDNEAALYAHLAQSQQRLEQERIHQTYANQILSGLSR